jgi:hypothetical protein
MMRDEEHHVDDILEAQTMTAMDALRNALRELPGIFSEADVGTVSDSLRRRGFAILPAIPLPR